MGRSLNIFLTGAGDNCFSALAGRLYALFENDNYIDAIEVIQIVAKQFVTQENDTGPASMKLIRDLHCLDVPRIAAASSSFSQLVRSRRLKWLKHDIAGSEIRDHWGQLMRDPAPDNINGIFSATWSLKLHTRWD